MPRLTGSAMANPVNRILRKFGVEMRRVQQVLHGEFVSMKTERLVKGHVLLAYIVEPFLLEGEAVPSQAHTHHTESLLIAEAFLGLGYNVDVIDYRNGAFQPPKSYTFFVSARTFFVEIAARLNADCIKIAHLDTAHFLFNNASAYRRLLELQQRRGVTTQSLRVIEHNFAVEHADYLTMLGNGFTESTYKYAGKPIFPLPVPTPNVYPARYEKDYRRYRKHFLWLGSGGVVHKGLDLVLEVFSELPDYHLTVCGPLDDPGEREFRQAFHRELYETANIKTIGWVDVSSQQFEDITSRCCGLVYPSCSEGQAGSVITCLQASLIPVISYQSGVDVDDFGIILNRCSHEEIRAAVTGLSALPVDELEAMSRKAFDYARNRHSRENYLQEFRKVITAIENPVS